MRVHFSFDLDHSAEDFLPPWNGEGSGGEVGDLTADRFDAGLDEVSNFRVVSPLDSDPHFIVTFSDNYCHRRSVSDHPVFVVGRV